LACGLTLTGSVSAQAPLPKPTQPQTGQAQVQQTNRFPPALYQMNDVSKSMNLTAEQIGNLNKITEQTQAQYRDNYNKLNSLNDAERFTRTQELHRQYANDWNKGARDIFNDNQRSRYQQYNYQYGGFNSLYAPEVQKSLNLTERQMKDLRDQSAWNDQQLQDINRTGSVNATKGAEMYRDYWKQRHERFNTFLTPDQQKVWGGMIGEPYTFQPAFVPGR
jgi:type III secretory pathway component EscR